MALRIFLSLVLCAVPLLKGYAQTFETIIPSGDDNGFGRRVSFDGNRILVATLTESAYLFKKDDIRG